MIFINIVVIKHTVVIVHNEDDHVFGGYTPCPWMCNEQGGSKHGTDESLTTFLFALRSDYIKVPQIYKLKEDKSEKAVCYLNNTAFDFGCNDFFLFEEEVC